MTRAPRNSMAAIMSVFVTLVMVLTGLIGAAFFAIGGADLFARSQGGARIEDTVSTPQLIAGLIGGLVVVAAILFICRQLQQILATLAAGDPFVPENAARLSRIAIAIAATELARLGVVLGVRALVPDASVDWSIDLAPWISVAALWILAQVFREGTRLRDEEKFTI